MKTTLIDTILERGRGVWGRLPPLVADLVLTLAVASLALGALLRPSEHAIAPVSRPAIVFTLAGALSLAARRRYTVAVAVVTVIAEALFLVVGPLSGPGAGLAVAVALYTLASRMGRQVSLRIATVSALVYALVLLVGVAAGRDNSAISLFGVTAVVAGSWSLGENVRTRRAYLAQLEERARRLEAARDEDARRAAQDERARIARELHDVVAHHVSAIAVHTSAAAAVAARQPERAYEALIFIQETSRLALTEMRTLLTVLHNGAEGGAERSPQPSLSQVAHLVGQSRSAGLSVTLEVQGAARPLPEALDLSAYRIVQEALTNSLKHAGGSPVHVKVCYAPDALNLEISDTGQQTTSSSTMPDGAGRGLIGMRERVALFGGMLDAGPSPDDDGFHVRAYLPLGGTTR